MLLVMVLVAVTVFVVVSRHTPGTAGSSLPPTSSTGIHGTLVYSVTVPGNEARLYGWDLGTGKVTEGPLIPSLVSLVDASGANGGWLGVTSRLPGGELQASVLRSLGPTEPLSPLLRGDLVAWATSGVAVAGIRQRSACSSCATRLRIDLHDLRRGDFEPQFKGTVAGSVLTVARDTDRTYFTLRRGDHVEVLYAGSNVLHRVLQDHVLVSISAAGDMLVEPAAPFGGHGDGNTTPIPPPLSRTAEFFRGLDQRPPLAYGDGRRDLLLDRVLAWSRDSSKVLVTGQLGPQHGFFELPLGPGSSPLAPTYLGAPFADTWATYMDDGVAIVEDHGHFFVIENHTLSALELPPGARIPQGPIVWIP